MRARCSRSHRFTLAAGSCYTAVMDLDALRRQLDFERQTVALDGEVLERVGDVVRLRAADGMRHSVIYSALNAETADTAIAREVEYYRPLVNAGHEVEWKVFAHDRPADLLQRLARHGFSVGEWEAVVVLDLAQRPEWIDEAPEHEILRIDSVEDLQLYRDATQGIFGDPDEATVNELQDGLQTGSTRHLAFVALEKDDEGKRAAVSAGRLYTHPQSVFGGLFGGGTLPGHRGRGYYRSLVAARARVAIELGAKYLLVDAMPTSRPILERLGFVHLTDTWPCELK